jgi:cellulose synthase/poly-beta-1,6-N-acetylglucosamine synthase-like glycosyltransferase
MTNPSMEPEVQFVELRRLPWANRDPKSAAHLTTGGGVTHRLATHPDYGDRPGQARPEWLEQVLHEQAAMLGPTQSPPALLPDVYGPKGIGFYHAWLDNESQRHTSYYFKLAWRRFAGQVRRTPCAAGEEMSSAFATSDAAHSALTTLTRGQAITSLLLLAVLVIGLYTVGPLTLTVLLGGTSLAYLANLTLTGVMAAAVIRQSAEEQFSPDFVRQLDLVSWPLYTVLCPLYGESAVVPQFVAAMQALDYPADKLQVLFLTETDDETTRESIRSLRLASHFKIVTVPDGLPRTKPRACNYGLLLARGSFVVVYDAEDVLTFANHDASLACVQARLGFYNTRQNLLTRWFAIEYALWFYLTLPGLQWACLSLPLGGTSNHFRADVLRRLGGWDVFNVTEDCDLGLRLAEHHLQTAILDSMTYEEANSDVRNWIRQRSRWIKGYMQTYLVHFRRPWDYVRKGRLRELFSLLAIAGGTPATFLVNPLMWALLGVYVAMRQTLAPEFHLLYIAPIFYPSVICLVAGNFLYMYLCLVACAKSEQFDLLPWVFTLPACWLLMCVAALLALFQLVVNPHHWEKTHHGLHLPQQQSVAMPDERLVATRIPIGIQASDGS